MELECLVMHPKQCFEMPCYLSALRCNPPSACVLNGQRNGLVESRQDLLYPVYRDVVIFVALISGDLRFTRTQPLRQLLLGHSVSYAQPNQYPADTR